MSENEMAVLLQIKQNNGITSEKIVDLVGISLRQTQRILNILKEKGYIERVGSKKNGHWNILK